jgi:hypothetical protein
MQRASPPKRGAAEPVNLKTLRNSAKTAQRPFGLVRSRVHLFARISCVFKERVSHRLGKWFSSFCRNKRTNIITMISTVCIPIVYGDILQTPPTEGEYVFEFFDDVRWEQIFRYAAPFLTFIRPFVTNISRLCR